MASATHATSDPHPAYSRAELLADGAVHGAGIAGAAAAAVVLLGAGAADRKSVV
jgi:hypothetical protein